MAVVRALLDLLLRHAFSSSSLYFRLSDAVAGDGRCIEIETTAVSVSVSSWSCRVLPYPNRYGGEYG